MGSQTKPSWKREAKFYRGEWERAYQGERDLMALLFRVRALVAPHVGDQVGITFEGWVEHAERLFGEPRRG